MATRIVEFPERHLLGLPAELRNEVYRHVFDDGGDQKQLQALLTCKRLYSEAVGLAFAATDFFINDRLLEVSDGSNEYKLQDKADRLPAALRTLVTKVNLRTEYKVDAMAVLFARGIRPTRITFPDIHDDPVYFCDESHEFATFNLPSAGLFEANPNLRLIVFSWLSCLESQAADEEADYMLYRIRRRMGEHIKRNPHKARPGVEMGHEYKFMTVLDDEVTEHEWSVIFEPPTIDGV